MLTEKEVRCWVGGAYGVPGFSRDRFIEIGKKKGYIKRSALEEAREWFNEWDGDYMMPKSTVRELKDLYEKAIEECRTRCDTEEL